MFRCALSKGAREMGHAKHVCGVRSRVSYCQCYVLTMLENAFSQPRICSRDSTHAFRTSRLCLPSRKNTSIGCKVEGSRECSTSVQDAKLPVEPAPCTCIVVSQIF
ncbi:unnamed protein product [Scytosiphon promiscuus]